MSKRCMIGLLAVMMISAVGCGKNEKEQVQVQETNLSSETMETKDSVTTQKLEDTYWIASYYEEFISPEPDGVIRTDLPDGNGYTYDLTIGKDNKGCFRGLQDGQVDEEVVLEGIWYWDEEKLILSAHGDVSKDGIDETLYFTYEDGVLWVDWAGACRIHFKDAKGKKIETDTKYDVPLAVGVRSVVATEGEDYTIQTSYVYPELLWESKDKYKELNAALQEFAEQKHEQVGMIKTDLRESVFSEYMEDVSLRDDREGIIMRADSGILSVLVKYNAYWGTDWNSGRETFALLGINFDPKTGKELMLTDVILDKEGFVDYLVEQISENYPSEAEYYNSVMLKGLLDGTGPQLPFTMDNEGMNVYLNGGDTIRSSFEIPNIRILFCEKPNLLKKEYIRGTKNYVIPFVEGITDQFDIDHDKELDNLYISDSQSDFEDDYNQYELQTGTTSYPIGAGWNLSGFVVKDEEHYLFYASTSYEGGSNVSMVDFEQDTYKQMDSIDLEFYVQGDYFYDGVESVFEATKYGFTNPNEFKAESRIDSLLGTFYGTKTYHMGMGYVPETSDQWYKMSDNNNRLLKTKTSISTETVFVDGTKTGDMSDIPEGQYLYIVRLSDEGWIDVQFLDDDRVIGDEESDFFYTDAENTVLNETQSIYRISIPALEMDYFYHDIEPMELFDGLSFAG